MTTRPLSATNESGTSIENDMKERAESVKTMTEEELAVRAQRGVQPCFVELVKRFGPRLLRYFGTKFVDRNDCDDLVQETLIKAYGNLHRFSPKHPFATWLYTIATRIGIDHLRARKRTPLVAIPPDLPAGESPYQTAVRRDELSRLWEEARKLPGRQFDAFWLRYAEEMPVRDIAGALGLTRVHVKVLLFRARTRLASSRSRDHRETRGALCGKPVMEEVVTWKR